MTASLKLSSQRLAVLTLVAALAGCSNLNDMLSGQKVDYRSVAATTRGKSLEVPPDLSQLAREGRYQPPAAVVSAAGSANPQVAAAPMTAGAATVAPTAVDGMQIVRDGQARWLRVPMAPEALWPQIKAFWIERGFTIAKEDMKAGVLETDWAENRAKLPQDGIRAALGRVLDNFYDTGERDLFRTRIERAANGSEVYISHRGMQEVYVTAQKDQTRWTTRPADPQLEAEFLSRLMVRLGAPEDVARTALAAPEAKAPRARAVAGSELVAIEIDDEFERAWRRVGLALDRSGFTVEDRNRADGMYFVRYVDKSTSGQARSFFGRLFGSDDEAGTALRYRLALQASGNAKSVLAVQDAAGAPAKGETAQQIAKVLLAELR